MGENWYEASPTPLWINAAQGWSGHRVRWVVYFILKYNWILFSQYSNLLQFIVIITCKIDILYTICNYQTCWRILELTKQGMPVWAGAFRDSWHIRRTGMFKLLAGHCTCTCTSTCALTRQDATSVRGLARDLYVEQADNGKYGIFAIILRK